MNNTTGGGRIRLTESKLKQIIRESLRKVINEGNGRDIVLHTNGNRGDVWYDDPCTNFTCYVIMPFYYKLTDLLERLSNSSLDPDIFDADYFKEALEDYEADAENYGARGDEIDENEWNNKYYKLTLACQDVCRKLATVADGMRERFPVHPNYVFQMELTSIQISDKMEQLMDSQHNSAPAK